MSSRWPTPSTEGSCVGVCCIDEPCDLTMTFTDENRCEDDNFDAYLSWTDESGYHERFLGHVNMVSSPAGCCGESSPGVPCPETVITIDFTVDPSEVSACCKITLELRFVSSNCCSTLANFVLEGPGGEITSSDFGESGISEEFDIRDICNPAP